MRTTTGSGGGAALGSRASGRALGAGHLLLAGVALGLPSAAAGSSFGVGIGGSVDLPDPQRLTTIPPAIHVLVPLRLDVTEHARIRTSFDAAFTRGLDTVSWRRGEGRMGFESDAFFVTGGLLVGPEVSIPTRSGWSPYFGASAGIALTVTAHSCWGNGTAADSCEPRGLPDLRDLFDPAHYTLGDLGQRNTVNPFSRQVGLATDLVVGVASDLLWVEGGYGARFVRAGKLHRGTPGIDLRREAYNWNAFRVTFGVHTTFGAGPD